MKAWERFLKAVHFEEVDHIPVVLWCSARYFASLAGMSIFDFIYDPSKKVEAQLYVYNRFPEVTFVPGKFSDYGDIIEIASALGCKIYWSEDSLPFIRGPIIRHDEDIDLIEIPDPKHDGFLAWTLKTLRLFTEKRRDFQEQMHFVESLGPGDLAGQIWGVNEFLTNLYLKPKLTKKLLSKTTEIVLAWLEAQEEALGGVEVIVLAADMSGLMSKEMYLEFLYPCHRLIREKYADHIMLLHCDTKADHLIESFANLGVDIWHFGPTTDISLVKERIGDRVVLMGNVDPVHIMQYGDIAAVRKASQECIEVARKGGGYLLSAGGGINYGTPAENIDAMIEVAKASSYTF